MPNTNGSGHGPRTAVLYARVSTDEQARTGYSLAQQIEALREYCAREGYEALEEVSDPGQSGASLERPGMDRVRDLVAGGGVSVVLAQDRDRFAREPAYLYLLREEFAERGTVIRALNDQGGDSPEGELTDGILDQLAKYERAKTAERMRRGKTRRAREGKVIGNQAANLGFRYDATRSTLVVDEEDMETVRMIFRLVGTEGRALYAVRRELERRRIITPYGRKHWSASYLRKIINSDVYRPHTYEEVAPLVSREVAAALDEGEYYGIWWWNRQRHTVKPVSEATPSGRVYRKQKRSRWNPREQWIAVPIRLGAEPPIPAEWIELARERIKDNPRPQSGAQWFFELAGVACCGSCGRQMSRTTAKNPAGTQFFYYRCTRKWSGDGKCINTKSHSAKKIEPAVWEKVRAHITSPGTLRRDLERMIELKRRQMRGDPTREVQAWLNKLSEAEKMRTGFQEQAARGLMTLDELAAKLAELEETREIARRELEAVKAQAGELAELERDKEELLNNYEAITPEALDSLTPEERNRFYNILKIKVRLNPDKSVDLEIAGAHIPPFFVSKSETESGSHSSCTRGWRPRRPSLPLSPR
jgi:site-specific DNA recombinase